MNTRSRTEEEGVPLDYLQHLDNNYRKLVNEMRRRGIRVLEVDWQEFGPPVVLWNKILGMSGSTESWYEQLSFSFAKQPRIPIMPNADEKKNQQ